LSVAAPIAVGRRPCPACGEPLPATARAAPPSDRRLAARNTYSLVDCETCGTASVVAAERSGERATLYRVGSYAQARGRVDVALEPLRRLAEWDRLRALPRLKAEARVLDVGAGTGRFLVALERAGYRARGLDPVGSGPRVERTTLEDADLPRAAMDAVVFWHVLEHLDDPAGALERARHTLVPGGALVLAVPNGASLQARLGGERWFQRDIPRHAVFFTERGVRSLLERSGFSVVAVRHIGLDQNLLAMWQTLLNRLTREQDVAFRALKRSLPHDTRAAAVSDVAISVVVGALLLVPAVALELAAGAARRGGSLVVQARSDGP
jgi:SAM-dependent methyltransferase